MHISSDSRGLDFVLYPQVPHPKNPKIFQCIDHGDWTKTTENSRARSIKDSMSKKVDDEKDN